MTDYISREEALEVINGIDSYFAKYIEAIPAADVVEVVRCKDCENYQTDWQPLSFDDGHYCAMVDTIMPYDGFCHMGERREDERLNRQTDA